MVRCQWHCRAIGDAAEEDARVAAVGCVERAWGGRVPKGRWCWGGDESDGGCGATFEGFRRLRVGGGEVGGGVEGVEGVEGSV